MNLISGYPSEEKIIILEIFGALKKKEVYWKQYENVVNEDTIHWKVLQSVLA